MALIASSLENGFNSSCKKINLLVTLNPNISGLVDKAWPSFTKPGPISPR